MLFGTLRIGCGALAPAIFLAFAGSLATPPSVRAAEYAVMEVRKDLIEPEEKTTAEGKQKSFEAKKAKAELIARFTEILNGRGPLDDPKNKKDFDEYFSKFFFATLTNSDELGNWVDRRERLLKMLTQSNIPPEVHKYTIELIFKILSDIVKGNYHPAARGNAMLMIGKLNTEEGSLTGDTKKLPEPHLPALRTMLDEFENPKQLDAVRAAALVGIQRHVDLFVQIDRQVPDDRRQVVGKANGNRIEKTMLDLVAQKNPPSGRSRAGHAWMRRTAVEVLGRLGRAGAGGVVLKTLDGLLTEEQESIALRCSAAEALGSLDYQSMTVNVPELAKKLGTVAVLACLDEVKRVEERQQREQRDKEQDLAASGMMPGMDSGMGGYGGGMGGGMPGSRAPDIYAYRLDITRRVVKSRLVLVLRGLTGPRLERGYPDTKTAGGPSKEETPAADGAKPAAKDVKTLALSKDTPFHFRAGIGALAKQEAEFKYVHTVIRGIDTLLAGLDGNKDLTSLTAAITTNVNSMKDTCKIVVQQGEGEELDATKREALLSGDDEGGAKPAGPPGKQPPTPPGKGAPAKGASATAPAKGASAPPPADSKAAGGQTPPAKPAATPAAPPAPPAKAPDPKATLSGDQP